ncbi:MAG: hypothetical protein Q9163_000651 [Psora crenata]
MPTLNRPNAPRRLPSGDIENPFFRAWALRRRSISGSSTPASTRLSPPPTSPTTIVTQRSANKTTDRRSLRSEGSSKPALAHKGITTSTVIGAIAPGIAQEKPSLLRSRASSDSFTSELSSSRSSISARARKFLNLASKATKDGAPPREVRKGFSWQHDTSGNWLEVRIGKARRTNTQCRSGSEGDPSLHQVRSPKVNAHHAPALHAGTVHDNLLQDSSKASSHGPLIDGPNPKEGLYCRTKRLLGLRRGESDEVSLVSQHRTMTGELLERTASMLRLLADKKYASSPSSTSTSTLSIAAPRWQRLRPGQGRRGSSSSSIRSLMMGKPPMSTPEEQEMYTASDGKQYMAVELTEPGAPTFLPSEAKRINTPPLKSAESGGSRIRGFFFDYIPPSHEEMSATPTTQIPASVSQAPVGVGKEVHVSEREWYRVKLDSIEREALVREQLVLDVPDHLPNSPLCPKHPKHRSGDLRICPMHGRLSPSTSTVAPQMLKHGLSTDVQTHPLEY